VRGFEVKKNEEMALLVVFIEKKIGLGSYFSI
jgi:hypothetical protein